jgi:YidC/Oxa1 family membrane protein insertase
MPLQQPDSINPEKQIQERTDQFGVFGVAAIGTEEFYTLENNLMKITFSNKGGRIYSVELKNYQTHDSWPLLLFDGPETQFGLNFFAQNRSIQTNNSILHRLITAKNYCCNRSRSKKRERREN